MKVFRELTPRESLIDALIYLPKKGSRAAEQSFQVHTDFLLSLLALK
jgi:hypothetical protein